MCYYIRILQKRWYIKDLGRFASAAFRNYGGGISVIQNRCISASGVEVCEHLKRYYCSVDQPPHIFWRFQKNVFPEDCSFQQKDSPTGDLCHYDIVGLSNGKAKRILNEFNDPINVFEICDNSNPRKLTESDLSGIQ